MNKALIILCGLEGSGKSTLTKAILPHLKNGAAFDAETILQVNPFEFNEAFQNLAISHAADLIFNFYEHGLDTVVAASFINDRFWYDRFRTLLPGLYNIYLIMLEADKKTRDIRRIARKKPTSKEARDWLDNKYPPDETLKDTEATGDYKYISIENSKFTVDEIIELIKTTLPGVFSLSHHN